MKSWELPLILKGKAFKGVQLFFFVLINLMTAHAHAQQNCMSCAPLINSLNTKDEQLDRTRIILKKNEDYLKDNPSASTSILVKVRSNILVSRLQIETLQNEKQLLENSVQEKGCDSCKTKHTKEH